jgi:hypothetical protein
MRIRDILSVPTSKTFGSHSKVRDSDLRAHHILQYAKRLLALGMPQQEVIDTVEDLEGLGRQEEEREREKNEMFRAALQSPPSGPASPQEPGTGLITIAQASEKYDVSQDSLRNRIKKGTLRVQRTDPTMVHEADVVEALKDFKRCLAKRKKSPAAECGDAGAALLTIRQACKKYHVAERTLRGRIKEGALRVWRTDPVVVHEADVIQVIKNVRGHPAGRKKQPTVAAPKAGRSPKESGDELLTLTQAAKKFPVLESTLYYSVTHGKLRSHGSHPRRVKASDVAEFVKNTKRYKTVTGEDEEAQDEESAKNTEHELITIAEAARMFSISKTFIELRVSDGRLEAYGARPKKIRKEDLAELVKNRGAKRSPGKAKKAATRKRKPATVPERREEAEKLRVGPLSAEENRKRLEELRQREEKRQEEWREPAI